MPPRTRRRKVRTGWMRPIDVDLVNLNTVRTQGVELNVAANPLLSTRRRPSDLLGRPNLQEQERKCKALLLSFPTSFIGNPAVLLVPPAATITACGFPLKTAGMTEGGTGRPEGSGQAGAP